jgi:hypothetical protein
MVERNRFIHAGRHGPCRDRTCDLGIKRQAAFGLSCAFASFARPNARQFGLGGHELLSWLCRFQRQKEAPPDRLEEVHTREVSAPIPGAPTHVLFIHTHFALHDTGDDSDTNYFDGATVSAFNFFFNTTTIRDLTIEKTGAAGEQAAALAASNSSLRTSS